MEKYYINCLYIYTHAAQPPSAIINHFSGRPIVTRYVSGLINGRNKNRIKLLVRSIINISIIICIYIGSFRVFVHGLVCIAGNCFYFTGALTPTACLYIIIILYQIGFRRVHWYSSTRFSQTHRHPLGVSEV